MYGIFKYLSQMDSFSVNKNQASIFFLVFMENVLL